MGAKTTPAGTNRRRMIAFRLGLRLEFRSCGNGIVLLALRFVILRSGRCRLMRGGGWFPNLRRLVRRNRLDLSTACLKWPDLR